MALKPRKQRGLMPPQPAKPDPAMGTRIAPTSMGPDAVPGSIAKPDPAIGTRTAPGADAMTRPEQMMLTPESGQDTSMTANEMNAATTTAQNTAMADLRGEDQPNEYQERNESVSERMNDLIARDNEYMQQARTRGKQGAASRGLLNTALGITAAESAALDAALPIASQEAAQASQRNIAEAQFRTQRGLQAQGDEAAMARLREEIMSREDISEADRQAMLERLGLQIGSTEEIAAAERDLRANLQAASDAAQKERLGMQLSQEEQLTLESFRQQMERLGMELESRETISENDIAAAQQRLETQIESTENLQAADIEAARERLAMQIASTESIAEQDRILREQLQLASDAAQKERLGMQLTSQEELALQGWREEENQIRMRLESNEAIAQLDADTRKLLQDAEIAAEKELLGMRLTQEEELALQDWEEQRERLGMQIDSQQLIANLDAETRERIAGMNIASQDLRAAASLAAGFESSYAQVLSGIMNNPEIPAAERQRYMDHAADMRDSNLNLIEQFFSVDLDWGGDEGGTESPRNNADIMRSILDRMLGGGGDQP